MSGLFHLAWQICLACVLAAAVRLLFPGGTMKSVINVILTLYIVTAVLPLGSSSWEWQWPQVEATSFSESPYQDYTQQLYLTAVEQQLQQQLQQAGIQAQVEISASGNCLLDTGGDTWEQAVEVLRQEGWQGGIIQREAQE